MADVTFRGVHSHYTDHTDHRSCVVAISSTADPWTYILETSQTGTLWLYGLANGMSTRLALLAIHVF
jgi:hypothetical protein